MGLFRSPRSRPGGSGAQEGRFRSPNRPNHQSREQMGLFRPPRSRPGALVRRKAGSAHQTDRITSLVSKWGCSAHQGAGQVLWCAGRPVPLTKSNRCGHGRSAVGNGQSAAGSGERAAGSGERAAGSGQRGTGSGQQGTSSGERAAGSGERTERRNRLRKGSAAKALIIQHLNADNCLQIRIILTTIAKNCRRQDRGESRGRPALFRISPNTIQTEV